MTNTALSQPLIRRLLPVSQPALRTLLHITVGVALITLLAQVRLTIGPVPITGQTLGVLLIGASYGVTLGSATLATYLLIGGLGLPVFQGAASGWAYMLGGTGGYLLGFLLAAAVIGYLAQRGWDKHFGLTALAMLIGNVIIYVPGLLWLNQLAPDWATTLQWGLTPFIVGDIVKLVVAAGLLPTAWKLLGR